MRDCVATLRIDFTRSEKGELEKNGQGDLLAMAEKEADRPMTGPRGQRDLSLRRLLFGSGVGGGVGVLFLEALDAASGVHELLLAGEEGVATGADFDAQHVALDG
jgi:hypothetical protein